MPGGGERPGVIKLLPGLVPLVPSLKERDRVKLLATHPLSLPFSAALGLGRSLQPNVGNCRSVPRQPLQAACLVVGDVSTLECPLGGPQHEERGATRSSWTPRRSAWVWHRPCVCPHTVAGPPPPTAQVADAASECCRWRAWPPREARSFLAGSAPQAIGHVLRTDSIPKWTRIVCEGSTDDQSSLPSMAPALAIAKVADGSGGKGGYHMPRDRPFRRILDPYSTDTLDCRPVYTLAFHDRWAA